MDRMDKILKLAHRASLILTIIILHYNLFINEKNISFINNTHFSIYIPLLLIFSYFHACILVLSYLLVPYFKIIVIIKILTYNF